MRIDTAIKVLQTNLNKEPLEILENKHSGLFNNINHAQSHTSNCLEIIQQAIKSVIKLDADKWEKIDNSYYYDFFQVRDEDKSLRFTYCVDKYHGLSDRGFCMKSSCSLNIDEIKIFLQNKDAINAFNKITGQPEFINNLTNAIYIITNDDFDEKIPDKIINIKLNKNERKLLSPATYIVYNITKNEFTKFNDTYHTSTYDDDSVISLTFRYIIKSHEQYIINNIDRFQVELNKKAKKYSTEQENIKSCLSKYIMLEAF